MAILLAKQLTVKTRLFQRYYTKESLVYYILISSHLPTSTSLNSFSPFNLSSFVHFTRVNKVFTTTCELRSHLRCCGTKIIMTLVHNYNIAEVVAIADLDPENPDLPRKPPPQAHQPHHCRPPHHNPATKISQKSRT